MPLITVRNLGGIGRFGNQCFLYMAAKAYALRYGCDLHCSDWIGRKIFVNATEPFVTNRELPQTLLDSDAVNRGLAMDRFFGRTDIDLRLYGQHQIYLDLYTRKQCREWLQLRPEYEALSKPHNQTVAHLRRGDFVDNQSFSRWYCEVSEQSYEDAMDDFKIPRPMVKVQEGWRPPPDNLPSELSWLADFLFMRDAPHLLRANSTFSFWAGVLGHGKVYSPLVEDKAGLWDVRFVEGNHACTAGKFKNQSDLVLREQ